MAKTPDYIRENEIWMWLGHQAKTINFAERYLAVSARCRAAGPPDFTITSQFIKKIIQDMGFKHRRYEYSLIVDDDSFFNIQGIGRTQLYMAIGTGRHSSDIDIMALFKDLPDTNLGGSFETVACAELLHRGLALPEGNMICWFDSEETFRREFPAIVEVGLDLVRTCRRNLESWPVEQTLAFHRQFEEASARDRARMAALKAKTAAKAAAGVKTAPSSGRGVPRRLA